MNKLKWFSSVLCVFGLAISSAHAGLISSDLTITGTVKFDTVNSVATTGNASQSADLKSIIGGSTVLTTIADVTPTGANPLGGGLTHHGDGVGVDAQASASGEGAVDGFFFDFDFALSNSSLTDPYTIFFELAFSNLADAGGDDAFFDAEINLFNSLLAEMFFSDLTSDTLFGDEKNGVSQPSFGATITDNGTFLFDITLAAGASNSFSALVKLDGESFTSNSVFSGRTSAFISVLETRNLTTPPTQEVPEPSTLMLFAVLIGLIAVKRKVVN